MSRVQTQPSFESHTSAIISDVRQAFGAIIERLSASISRPADLNNLLKIDRKLGWKISKVLSEQDPFRAALHMPGAAAIKIFLKAAAAQEVPEAIIEAAKRASDEFERLVAMHAGRRDSFDRMLTGCSQTGRGEADLACRKAAVTANSLLWNVHARTLATTWIVSLKDNLREIAGVRGCVGFRGYRPNTSWVIARTGYDTGAGTDNERLYPEPLVPVPDESEGVPGVPLLADFCSKPLPKIRQTRGPDGCMEYVLADLPVGNTGEVTCIIGNVVRGMEHDREPFSFNTLVRCPVDALLMDVFMPASFGPLPLKLLVYNDLATTTVGGDEERNERDLMDIDEPVRHLGRGLRMAYTVHVPRYTELLNFAFERLGWSPEEFELYRFLVEYPVMPTSIQIAFVWPEFTYGATSSSPR